MDYGAEPAGTEMVIPGVFERNGLYEVVGDLGAGKTMVELGLIVKYAFPAGFRCGRIDLEKTLTR